MELGIGELIFIFVMALLLFGPKKLPEIGRQVAKIMNDFKAASSEFKSTLESEVAKLEVETNFRETFDAIQHPIQNIVARGQAMLTEAVTPGPSTVLESALDGPAHEVQAEVVEAGAPAPEALAAGEHPTTTEVATTHPSDVAKVGNA